MTGSSLFDLARTIPAGAGARADAAATAIAVLRAEQRRLERLGLEQPLALCHHRLRTWEFVAAILALPGSPRGSASPAWPAAPPL